MKILKAKGAKIALTIATVAVLIIGGVVVGINGVNRKVLLTAMLPDASPIIPGNVVRASGIQVGEVKAVGLVHGQAAVTLELDPQALPVHQDASVQIRPVTLLGERFIQLNRGSPNAPVMGPNGVIPPQRTSRSVDLDQVLDSLDNPTSTSLAALATTAGEGVNGQGGNVDNALKALAPAMQNTQQLGDVLNQQNAVLSQLVDRASPVATAAAGQDNHKLDQTVDSTRRMLNAVATQRQSLGTAVQQLPETLTKAQRVLSQAAGVAQAGTPTLQAARPVTDKLPQITNELNSFSDSANPALGSLPPVLNKAQALLDQARPAVRDLRPGADALPEISASTNRLVGQLTPEMKTALDFIKYWAMSTNGRDALGNYFRAFVVTTPKSLLQVGGAGIPGAPQGGGPPVAGPPGPGQSPAPPTGLPGNVLPGVGQLLPGQKEPAPQDGSATGLDQKQEGSLVDQLLGGN